MSARILVTTSPLILSLAATLAGCGAGAGMRPLADTAKIIDSIKSGEVRWNADWRAGDAGKIASHYAPDAVVMTPGAPAAVGAAAIRSGVDQAVAESGSSLVFSSDRVDVSASGDLAAARGTYRRTGADPRTGAVVIETGSYVTVYKPGADGVWRAVWDINTPAATPIPIASP